MKKIAVFGPGCMKCKKAEENVRQVLVETRVEATVEHVTEMEAIVAAGVMSTPAVAIDGVEAMNRLRAAAFDLVIADIQMPRMDGFELLREMKTDARFSKIPVIMVTSLESRQDQEQGLSLGADAYIVKRKFDQQEILNTIRQLL